MPIAINDGILQIIFTAFSLISGIINTVCPISGRSLF
jgi:hypothetical protein